MSKAILVSVTVYDDETGETVKQITKNYESDYGYQIERCFSELGEVMGRFIDPNCYAE